VNAIAEFFKTLGGPRLAAMGAVAAGLVGIFVFLIMRFSQPQMEALFSELPINDSSAIVRQLETMNIPYEISNEGATIRVPKERVLRLRMTFAEDGLPAGSTVGYEIFDKSGTLGATSFVQNVNHLRALEGELARTIRSLNKVRMARVHLVLPKRQLFARGKAEPSASIVLRTSGSIDKSQIKAIQHLTSSAVTRLKPSMVSIVDQTGQLLATGVGDENGSTMTSSIEERNTAHELKLKTQIEQIVGSIVGRKNARVQVTAERNYNRVTQTSDTFDPESSVVRSIQTRSQTSASTKGKLNAVSVGNELPNAQQTNAKNGNKTSENADKTDETRNFEISKITKTEIIEAGRIKRISVAVLVDGIYSQGANNQLTYAPRPQAQLDQIAGLVRTAIGFSKDRGDQVQVANIRFAPPPAVETLPQAEEGFLNLTKTDYFKIAELAVLLIIALLVLLLIIRPLVRRILTPDEANSSAQGQISGQSADSDVPQLTAPDGTPIDQSSDVKALLAPKENRTSAMMDVAQMAGEMQQASIQKAGEIVVNNPDEATIIVRQWLQEATS